MVPGVSASARLSVLSVRAPDSLFSAPVRWPAPTRGTIAIQDPMVDACRALFSLLLASLPTQKKKEGEQKIERERVRETESCASGPRNKTHTRPRDEQTSSMYRFIYKTARGARDGGTPLGQGVPPPPCPHVCCVDSTLHSTALSKLPANAQNGSSMAWHGMAWHVMS